MFTETYFTNRLSGALILSILFTFIFNTFISAREKNHSFYFIPQLGQSGKIVSVWFDKDENYFYSKSESQSIIKWNLGGRILNKTYVNNKSDSRGFRLIAERCNTPNLNKIKIKFKYEDKSYSINDGNKNYKIKLRYKYSGNCYDYHPAAKMILIANDDGSIAIVKSGKILKEFKAHQKRINMIKFNSSGSQFITASNDSKLSIWSNAGIRKKTMVHPCEITSASFSGSNSKTISGCRDGSIRIWNKKGKLLKKITPAVQSMVGAEFFPGNNKLLILGEKEILLADIDGYHISKLADFNKYVEKVRIHQASESFLYWGDENILIFRDKHLNLKFRKKYTAKIYTAGFYNHSSQFYVLTYSGDLSIHDFQGNTIKKFIIRESPYTMKTFQIHPDDKYFLYSWKKQTRTYNTNPESLYFSDLNGSIIRKINLDKEISISVNKVSPDGKYFIYNTDENRLIVINLISGKKHSIDYAEKRNPREQVILFHMAVDPESKKLSVLHFETGKIKEYSITGKLLNEYSTGISNSGGTLSYNHDGSLLISGNLSGPIIIFNTINKEAVTYIRKNDRWIIYSNDGYFDASRNIGDLVMMSDGKNIFSVDQFAIYNNRPDIILKKLNIYNSDKIDHYYSHFKQRLKRLSMKEKRFSQVSFAPKTIIKSENRNKNRYIINLEFKDSHSGLHNYNVYVNGVPISGIEGKSLKGRHASVKEEILLTPGKNLIEISCVNNDGIESVRLLRNKNYKSEKKGNLYFLGFGISSYKNKDYNLKFASKDISDFSKFLSNFKNKYSNVYARTYLNSEVSHENFIKSKMFLKNAKENDTVILFLAGHGMYDRTGEAKYYFLTYESDLKNLSRKSIPFHEIEELIADNGARRKLVLLDTCESGEVEESYWKESLKFANSRGFEVRKNKSAKTVKKKRRYLFNKNRFIYNDLLRRTGAVIFSSSRGGELSFESIQHRNGFFTNALMDGLKGKADLNSNGAITIDELRVFVTKTVSKQTENHQNPTIDRDNIHQQISFPVQK